MFNTTSIYNNKQTLNTKLHYLSTEYKKTLNQVVKHNWEHNAVRKNKERKHYKQQYKWPLFNEHKLNNTSFEKKQQALAMEKKQV